MNLPEFEYLEPASVAEAHALIAEDPGGSRLFAGGTDILVYLKEGPIRHRRLVSLRRIEELGRVEFSEEKGLSIGATATINRVARHEAVRRHYPALVDAAMCVAADQVRNLATIGGNICNAVPSADMAPVLLAHEATLRISSVEGERTLPIADFFVGPRKTVLGPGDVLASIEIVPPQAGVGGASIRQGGRASLSLPVSLVAAVVAMDGETCTRAKVALGAVAPTPVIADEVGRLVAGKQLTEEVLAECGERAAAATKPIGDVRSSKEYRLESVKVLTKRALNLAAERAPG